MGSPKVYINTNSQTVVNAVKGKITGLKDIINLVKGIKWLSVYFNDFVLEYCCKNANKEADVITKNAHM